MRRFYIQTIALFPYKQSVVNPDPQVRYSGTVRGLSSLLLDLTSTDTKPCFGIRSRTSAMKPLAFAVTGPDGDSVVQCSSYSWSQQRELSHHQMLDPEIPLSTDVPMLAMDSVWPRMQENLSFWREKREKLLLAISFPSTDSVRWQRKSYDSITFLTHKDFHHLHASRH
jgi:hypothetical protein